MPKAAVVNPARGTKLRHGVAGVYTAIANIVSLDGPSREIGTRDTTNLDSAARTYAFTIFEGGEVSGQIEYDPQSDSHQILEGLLATPLNDVQWQVLYQDTVNGTTTASFVGILTKFASTGIEVEANLLADFTIKVSGVVTVALGV